MKAEERISGAEIKSLRKGKERVGAEGVPQSPTPA
jgi:hypothetical protein